MAKYGEKNVIVDLGFIDGCIRANAGDDTPMVESVYDALSEMENEAISGDLSSRKLIHNLGFIRGVLWMIPMPGGYSDAIDRLMEYLVEGSLEWYQLPQPFTGRSHDDPVLSDDLREEIYSDYFCEGKEYAAETARHAGFDQEFILDRIVPPRCRDESGRQPITKEERAANKGEHTPEENPLRSVESGSKGQNSDITDEGDTVSPDRRRSAYQAIPDDCFDEVRQLSETMTDDEIAKYLGSSRDTVLRFRKRHGIKKNHGPRQGKTRWECQWEPWQKQKLVEMKLADQYTWKQIGEAINKKPNQCSGMWHWERKKIEAQGSAILAEETAVISGPVEDAILSPIHAETPQLSVRRKIILPGMPDGSLKDDDWTEIKKMLADGRTREAIAGDFDIELDELNAFIEERLKSGRERLAARSAPGEAPAPLR